MFKQDILKQRYVSFGIVAAAIALLAVVFAFSSENVNTDSYAKASDTKVVKKHHKAKNQQQQRLQPRSSQLSKQRLLLLM